MNENTNLEIGDRFVENKQYREAEEFYNNLLKTSDSGVTSNIDKEDLARAYNNLGFVLYKQVRFSESLEKYTKALELNETFSASYYNRGTIHYRLGGFDLALQDMKKAVALDSSNSEFLLGLQACEDKIAKNENKIEN